MEKNNLFTEEKVSQIYQEYLEFCKNIDIKEIENFLRSIEKNIIRDFRNIQLYNESKEIELYKLSVRRFLFSLFGISQKSFEKYIENGIKLQVLEEDLNEYFEKFAYTLEETKNGFINIFKIYYEIILNRGTTQDLREMYAIYHVMIMSIIHSLPQSYRKDLFSTYYFSNLNEQLNSLESYDDFNTLSETVFVIQNPESVLRDYIEKKYDVDLYEEQENKERKLV